MKETESAGTSSVLPTDISKTIKSLNALSVSPKASSVTTEAIWIHVAALSSWGEALNIEQFITLSKATMTLLSLSPEHVSVILQLAMDGFHAVYELESRKRQFTDKREPDQIVGPFAQAEIDIHLQPDTDEILKTSNLFIWETRDFVFTIPADEIAEILIPKAGQIIQSEQYRGLRWHNHIIPLYELVQSPSSDPLLPEMALTDWLNDPSSSMNCAPTVLVITCDRNWLALSVNIESLITEPELKIIPFALETQPPHYYYGYIQRADKQQLIVNAARIVDQALNQTQIANPNLSDTFDQQTFTPHTVTDKSQSPAVMVVDDSPTVRQILALKLKEIGFQVIQAQDGQDGLSQLQRYPVIQLVVCDVDMPHMNGFEFLSQCRRDPHFAKLPIVMLSTYNDDQHRHLARQLGANAYFGKPYEEAEFLDALKAIVN